MLISCPSYGPIWVDGRVLGTHFQRRIHPCARIHPFRVYERVQIPEIILAIVAMHALLVKQMKATAPRSLDASECLGRNREAKKEDSTTT